MFTGLASYGNVVDRASVPVCVQAAEGLVLREAEGYAADFLRGEVVVRYVQVEQPTRFSATRQNRKTLHANALHLLSAYVLLFTCSQRNSQALLSPKVAMEGPQDSCQYDFCAQSDPAPSLACDPKQRLQHPKQPVGNPYTPPHTHIHTHLTHTLLYI